MENTVKHKQKKVYNKSEITNDEKFYLETHNLRQTKIHLVFVWRYILFSTKKQFSEMFLTKIS